MNLKYILSLALIAVLSSALTILSFRYFGASDQSVNFKDGNTDPQYINRLTGKEIAQSNNPDFVKAALMTTPTVVHIVATQTVQTNQYNEDMPDIFREFFGDEFGGNFRREPRQAQSSGSGVIVTADGYIVTNNHVVEGAGEIEVVLSDKRTYTAKVIGTAPSTDLAVIKINEKKLPHIELGNSDQVMIGEWVLAVGNPFNLASTVTAGIVSAKGRSLNILRDKSQAPIEAFIQTDAAVNPGNSGGALINTKGQLIGINTAIATPTGTYAGYSFAVPVNIVRKVMKDLIQYGTIQRGYLGIIIRDVEGNLAKEKGLKVTEGVYVDQIDNTSSAYKAGVKIGDVIVGIENKEVKSSPELLGMIAEKSPGDKIKLKVNRKGKVLNFDVVLKNKAGNEELITRENTQVLDFLDAELADVKPEELRELGIRGGVKVTKINQGKLAEVNMRNGFIITKLGDEPVLSLEDFVRKIENMRGGIFLSGVYPDTKQEAYYAFGR
ncbi:MAG: Do family serine endopeptidase [Microscillaceae bacterium]|nr:Do family serine endopeptidase [Microscillaceae bacterium]